MKIFTYEGEKDTLMTPRDSIIYYKHMLQTGMMAMEPVIGPYQSMGWRCEL